MINTYLLYNFSLFLVFNFVLLYICIKLLDMKKINELVNIIMTVFVEFTEGKENKHCKKYDVNDLDSYYEFLRNVTKEYIVNYDLDPFDKSDVEYWDGTENVSILEACRATCFMSHEFQEFMVSRNESVLPYIIYICNYYKYVTMSPKLKEDYSYVFESDEIGLL